MNYMPLLFAGVETTGQPWRLSFGSEVIWAGLLVKIDPRTPVVEAPPFYVRQSQSECTCEYCDKTHSVDLTAPERLQGARNMVLSDRCQRTAEESV
jgi:hypothetical protein